MKLRDRLWLWGHEQGYYNNNRGNYGNFVDSRMSAMEACLYLGINNTFMTELKTKLNKRQYNKSFTTLLSVAWNIGDDLVKTGGDMATVDKYLEDAKDFPNVTATVFDDFKSADQYKKVPLENFKAMKERLRNNDVRPIDSWMVLYTHEFGVDKQSDEDFMPYIEVFDGIIMWTWKESDIDTIPEKFEIFKKLTKTNKRMFGLYLYNFGEAKPATREAVLWQLDFYREKLMAGEVEGIVLLTNTMADLDLDAFDAAIEWIKEHGDEEVPDLV